MAFIDADSEYPKSRHLFRDARDHERITSELVNEAIGPFPQLKRSEHPRLSLYEARAFTTADLLPYICLAPDYNFFRPLLRSFS